MICFPGREACSVDEALQALLVHSQVLYPAPPASSVPRAMSSFYTKDGNLEDIEAELKHRFDQREWDWRRSLEETVQSAKTLENYSLTDFWAYLVVSKQTREVSHP